MSFPRYPRYKDSGVEWLGKVPEHWEVLPIKRLGYLKAGAGFPAELQGSTGDELSFHKVNSLSGAGVDGFLPEAPDTISREGANRLGAFVFPPSTAVFAKVGAALLLGRIAILQHESCIDNNLMGLIAKPPMTTEFLRHAMAQVRFDYIANPGAVPSINERQIGSFPLVVPTSAEQQAIAAFLDRETAKIDALIAEQQRLIELLQEKRQAVISHAVTKGLNPDAPMKDSGIEWLDVMPAHWRAMPVKHLAAQGAKTFTDGDWIESPYITDEGVRLIQTGNVGIGVYKEQGFRYVTQETYEALRCTEVKPHDVLICRLDGPVGRACLAPDLGVRMITSVDNAILKVSPDVSATFVVALMSSLPWLSWIDALCRVGGGFRLRVSRSQLGELRVPLPPRAEQDAIMERISSHAESCNTLAFKAASAISLLQERRSALISAAVTGQIDVRGLAGSDAA